MSNTYSTNSDRITQIEKHHAAITPGKWRWQKWFEDQGVCNLISISETQFPQDVIWAENMTAFRFANDLDRDFIALAPEYTRFLLDEVKRLRAALEQIADADGSDLVTGAWDEWTEAEAFTRAQEIAAAALTGESEAR